MRLSQFPALLRAYGSIKLAAARANERLGVLTARIDRVPSARNQSQNVVASAAANTAVET